MKAPSKPKPTLPKQTGTQKTTGKNAEAGFNFGQAMMLASTSVEAFKSYSDLQKEKEVTRRTHMEAQKEIELGEMRLREAEMEHANRRIELDNADKDSERRHEQEMRGLEEDRGKRNDLKDQVDRKLDQADHILDLLEAGKISGEEAAVLLRTATQE
jgi:hypothetical protein